MDTNNIIVLQVSSMKGAREHYLPLSPASRKLFTELKVDFKNWGIPKAE
jgi:hypothetical protein